MKGIRTIFWDFNGTLLDDTSISIEAMNILLQKRGLAPIDEDQYKKVFGFPVKDYYQRLGLTFKEESFEDVSSEFIREYSKRVGHCGLHNGVSESIRFFYDKGCQQVIISAMEQQMLEELLAKNRILHHFDAVHGLKNTYAKGKTHIAQDYVKSNGLDPRTILFIGDTLHDSEVAKETGCHIVLVSNGHNSYQKLKETGHVVKSNLLELIQILRLN